MGTTILNLSKLAQVKMKFTSAILIGISASLARADWGPGGGFGGYGNGGDWGNNWGWGGAPDCAKTCFSSIFPAQSTAWSSACASQTIIDNCVTSACPTATAEYASASSVRSEWCSSYSSCSTAQTHAPLTGHGGVGSMAMDGEVTGVAKAQMESLPSPLRVDRLRVSPREPSQ